MAENLPINFNIPAENVIATYNYTDLAEGTGMSDFYGMAINTGWSGAVSYILTEKNYYSTQARQTTTYAAPLDVHTSGAVLTADADPANSFDLDFDLTSFNTPRVIKGTAIIQVPWAQNFSPSGALSGALVVQLQKYDGSTETTFASGAVQKRIDASGTNYYLTTLKVPVSSEVLFKTGETLRVNVIGRVLDSNGTAQMSMAHDPQARAGSSIYTSSNIASTTFKCSIPFKIER
jgi:hypothetical protein